MTVLYLFTRQSDLGASSRYRSIQYIEMFRASGYSVYHRPFFTNKYLKRKFSGRSAWHIVVARYFARLASLVSVRRGSIVLVEKAVPVLSTVARTRTEI